MPINDYSIIANKYASLDNSGTAFLAFKHIPNLLRQYAAGTKTLDYGCGSGSSTFFLNEIGLKVEGVDISQDMLEEAKQLNKDISFNLIDSGRLPHGDNTFDIVFSSFVLFEIASKNELSGVINEVYRVLKKGGIFIAITGSEELYKHKWLSLDVNFERNKILKSGDIATVLLKDAALIVYDYYWTHDDYQELINGSNFSLLDTLYPLGDVADGYLWEDEKYFPPYVIYVLLK